jgi:hypothetical protein
MADISLRELFEADRENLLDVVDWLARMPQDNFEKHVRRDLTGDLDPVAHQALRHPDNLLRWNDTLTTMHKSVNQQLADPGRRGKEYADWRRRAIVFQASVSTHRAEAKHLLRQQYVHPPENRAKPKKVTRQEAGERAIQRLVEAHRGEFLAMLAEELKVDGLSLSEAAQREAERLATDVRKEAVDA